MIEPVDLTQHLNERAVLREGWLRRLVGVVETDERIRGLWIVGSMASGEADPWSDIDLIVSCEQEVIEDRRSLARKTGAVLLEWDAAQNAAPGAMHYCNVYDLGPLPFPVDWHLWPTSIHRPKDSEVVFERLPSESSALTFQETQERNSEQNRGRPIPEMPEEQRRNFRLSMLFPICKDLARGWPKSSAMMVEWLGLAPPGENGDWGTALDFMLDTLALGFPVEIRQKYMNLVRLAEFLHRLGDRR